MASKVTESSHPTTKHRHACLNFKKPKANRRGWLIYGIPYV